MTAVPPIDKLNGWVEDPAYTFPQSADANSGNNYVFPTGQQPAIIALRTNGFFVKNTIYYIRATRVKPTVAASNIVPSLGDTPLGWSDNRGTDWEVLKKEPLGVPLPITYPPSGDGPRPVDTPIVEQKK